MVQGTTICSSPYHVFVCLAKFADCSVRYIPIAEVDGLPHPQSVSMSAFAISGSTGYLTLRGYVLKTAQADISFIFLIFSSDSMSILMVCFLSVRNSCGIHILKIFPGNAFKMRLFISAAPDFLKSLSCATQVSDTSATPLSYIAWRAVRSQSL